MARLATHELAYAIEAEVIAKLRSLKIARPKSIADDLVPKIINQIPTEAFDPKPTWEYGLLYFHGEVTEEYCREMQDELHAVHHNIKPGLPITIYLSSIGGELDAGLALISTIQELRRAGRVVNGHVQGCAMSMGSIMLQACDVRTIEPFAVMMIHEVSACYSGKTLELEDVLAIHKRQEAQLAGMYAERSGKPVDFWRDKMARKDCYFLAREAVTLGLVDRIKPTKSYKAARAPKRASKENDATN